MQDVKSTDELVARIERLAQRTGIRLILQFGSTVSGVCHTQSDVDLAIMFEGGDVPWRILSEIGEALQACFPDRNIDLAVLNRADPLFLKKVVEHCRLLFGKPEDLAQLCLYAFKRYQDHRRFLELERQFVGRRLAALNAGQSHDD